MPNRRNLSDNELIFLLQKGNHNAYTEIYNRYYYLMYVFAYKKLREEDLAKDFVQELFANLWHKREDISTTGNFAAFLYISMRNKILDYFLHEKVVSRYLSFLKDYQPLNTQTTADHLIREKLLAEYIERQIAELPEKMRSVFELSRKKHHSHKEIAEKLHISELTVTRQISNALKILKTKLGILFVILSASDFF